MKAARVYHIVVKPFGSPISVIYDRMANEFMERARAEGAPARYVCAYMHIHLHICDFFLDDLLCRRPEPEESPICAEQKALNIRLYQKFKRLVPALNTLIPLFRDHNDALQTFAEAVSVLSDHFDCVSWSYSDYMRGCGACRQHAK
jgi:hypothetical protein